MLACAAGSDWRGVGEISGRCTGCYVEEEEKKKPSTYAEGFS
jgi:hypothetical protein